MKVWIFGISLFMCSIAQADVLVMPKAMNASTIAQLFIEKEGLRLDLEVGIKDIDSFKNILPDNLFYALTQKSVPFKERLNHFFQNDFIIKADNKILYGLPTKIQAKRRVKRDSITGEVMGPSEDPDDLIIDITLKCPYQRRPNQLSVSPPLNIHHRPKTEIGFIAYHQGLPVNDFAYLGRTEALKIAWDDPWYSQFNNKQLRRRYNYPLSAFLYVEPYEVRQEIIVRPKDLQRWWLDLGLSNKTKIIAKDKDAIKKKVAEFFKEKNPIFIDGKLKKPMLSQVYFVRRGLKNTMVVPHSDDLSLDAATLGVIYSFSVNGLPQAVSMHWKTFSEGIQSVNAQVVDQAGSLPYILSGEYANIKWQNFLKKPKIPKMVVIPAPVQSNQINKNESKLILTSLLKNIYHAFDFQNEEKTYDILAMNSSGDLLTKIYLETRKSLTLKNQDSVKVKVNDVIILTQKTDPLLIKPGFQSHLTWQVNGSVGHWGHIHQRKNQYDAIITVEPIDKRWKITNMKIVDEKKL